MMTLEEAIEKEKEMSEPCSIPCEDNYDCTECRKLHEQIAEWLEELKEYRASIFSGDMTQAMLKEERNKAIDDFLEKIQWEYLNGCGIKQREIEFLMAVSNQIAEQLKAGGENENP